jgi:hypothetical protein
MSCYPLWYSRIAAVSARRGRGLCMIPPCSQTIYDWVSWATADAWEWRNRQASVSMAQYNASKSKTVEFTNVDSAGHTFSDFYVAPCPSEGLGWYIFGRRWYRFGPDREASREKDIRLCGRPKIGHEGWATAKEAEKVLIALSAK